ncbi:MAG: ATP-binding protein [Prevotellaceae bacterium]|jgi:predicted AAA+ superfamily ATPase|nr:ATP-binding protein [Prevotellaceae bacterium]
MYQRKQIFEDAGNESVFLWGARQTGKSTLLKQLFPNALWFDLLLTSDYERLLKNPGLIREMVAADPSISLIVIDEIQRLPELLNEIHWLIANKNIRFIMSGSSPRKILRSGANLLGGRALRYELYPLTSSEIPGFDLLKALNNGLLPKHYDTPNAKKLLSAYIGSYLRDEIAAEARLRNVAVFSRFLEIAALTNGEIIHYSNVAADTGVSVPTVKAYFQILEDTLLGRYLPAFQKRPKRRIIMAPKFYLFDVGIVNTLLNRGRIEPGTELFGKSFEHFIYEEIYAHSRYSALNYPLAYWRTTSQLEIDFVLGDHEAAIEVKSTSEAQTRHLKGLKAFAKEYPVKKLVLVSNDPYPRMVDNIWILPWQTFLQQLWNGEIIA